jgi:SAM-dependent methyltransferase
MSRFWAFFANHPQAERAYFSGHSGDALIALAARYVPLEAGRVLDYGCGLGFLLERLLRRGVQAAGLEFSPESAERARQRCAGQPGFGGVTLADAVPSPLPASSVDGLFLVEVLEHLPDRHLDATLADVRRLLRPGGWLVASTPHAEDIESAKTVCPDCGSVFHPWQHVRSFTAGALGQLLAGHGFEPVLCRATNLGGTYWSRLRRLGRRLLRSGPASEPHLVYIGRKHAAPAR